MRQTLLLAAVLVGSKFLAGDARPAQACDEDDDDDDSISVAVAASDDDEDDHDFDFDFDFDMDVDVDIDHDDDDDDHIVVPPIPPIAPVPPVPPVPPLNMGKGKNAIIDLDFGGPWQIDIQIDSDIDTERDD